MPMNMLLFVNKAQIVSSAWAPALPALVLRTDLWYLWDNTATGSALLGVVLSQETMTLATTFATIAAVPALASAKCNLGS